MARGSRISAGTGRHGGEDFNVRIVVEGAEKTSDEFKQIRRTINGRLREAMVRAGERSVLPAIKGDLPAKWGDTLFRQARPRWRLHRLAPAGFDEPRAWLVGLRRSASE
jgi:hypothetical protein